ncbi:MAG: FHA domain-containing protein [Polyangiaceae bacterium]|nr:FHA domain-containing protein [Polyangiaceae bacterium]
MNSDPNKKSPRNFQCRDVLWDTFEQMARELECSVDYLINESMKQYARQRSKGGPALSESPPAVSRRPGSVLPPPPRSRTATPGGAGFSPAPPPLAPAYGAGRPNAPFPPPPPTGVPPAPTQRSSPPGMPAMPGIPQGGGRVPSAFPSPQGVSGGGSYPPPPVQNHGGAPAHSAQSHGQQNQLSLLCDGEKVQVNKDRFIIGRGKQSSDYTLKDPNVSRQHAMVVLELGSYYLVDMGSTNGIEFNGQRVARKQIQEGDMFKICDHDLRFTFR